MPTPTHDAQLAEIHRRGRVRAMVAVPFLVVGWAAAWLLNDATKKHLDAALYQPACVVACERAGGRTVGNRLAGRGSVGTVRCECANTEETWHDADLSRGAAFDQVLHWGGQEAAFMFVFAAFSIGGLVAGSRLSERREREVR